jgi:hypothetical protein
MQVDAQGRAAEAQTCFGNNKTICFREDAMKNTPGVKFDKDYKPDKDACVELFNGRFVDVANGGYFNDNVKVIIKSQRKNCNAWAVQYPLPHNAGHAFIAPGPQGCEAV